MSQSTGEHLPDSAIPPWSARGWPRWSLFPLVAYALTRALDAALLMVSGRRQVALVDGMDKYHLTDPMPADPGYWALTTNWDGQWYKDIALHGYPKVLPTTAEGAVDQNPWGFFPGYPLTVRAAMTVTHLPFEIAGPIVATALGGLAMVLLYRLLMQTAGSTTARATVVGVCCFPAAPMLQVTYPESLALLLLVLALTSLRRRAYLATAVLAVLLALTRPLALPLGLAMAVWGLWRWLRRSTEPFPPRERSRVALLTGFTIALTGLWPLITALVTGRTNAYLETMRGWEGYATLRFGTGWYLALTDALGWAGALLLLLFIGWSLVVVLRKGAAAWGPELRAWVAVYPLYLVAISGAPSVGTLRYLLLTPVWVWPLPDTNEGGEPSALMRMRILALLFLAATGLWGQYVWVSQIMVIHSGFGHQPGPP